jgi:hypothetical protein
MRWRHGGRSAIVSRNAMTHIRMCALGTAAALAASPVRAQTPETFAQIPVIPGSRHDVKAESLLAAANGAPNTRVYRIEASIEEVFKWYRYQLAGNSGDPVDSPTVHITGLTPVTYHINFYTYDDACADSTGSAPPCREWRRGKDKRRALGLSRLPWDTGQWIENAMFTWFCRDPDGALRRMRVEIRDIGLKPNWKYYHPLGLVRIENVVLERPRQ